MSLPVPPLFGLPIPNNRHAVSVQLPTWKDVCDMALGKTRVKDVQQAGYPRSFLHRYIKELANACIQQFGFHGEHCYLFPTSAFAHACKVYIIRQKAAEALVGKGVTVRAMAVQLPEPSGTIPEQRRSTQLIRLYGVFCSSDSSVHGMNFWRLTGTGISSRLAELCLTHLVHLQLAQGQDLMSKGPGLDTVEAHEILCERIAGLLAPPTIYSQPGSRITKHDIYLYPTGMSAIYHLHHLLLDWRGTQSVVFGFPYELTFKLIDSYGPGCIFFGFGSNEEVSQLETFLELSSRGPKLVQAIWCECPSNPLLHVSDLDRIRRLADKYGILVVVDDTIGSFANVDVMSVADVAVTSLTKSFSGYADVMGGSISFNPCSQFYQQLKSLLDVSYRNHLFEDDAKQLEINSRDYISRSKRLNATASSLVNYMLPYVENPNSTLTAIYYPSVSWSAKHYRARMRPETESFTPGFGGLFTLEFNTVTAARTFFDAIEIHKGPSLGAHLTIALPYVQTVFQTEKEWAAQYGVKESIVRISVGLEDPDALRKAFEHALRKADEAEM